MTFIPSASLHCHEILSIQSFDFLISMFGFVSGFAEFRISDFRPRRPVFPRPARPDLLAIAVRETRMQSVQSPIIPVVADLIRQVPGTISLGQGVVSYGPPPQAAEELARFLADPENHKYKPV